MLALRSRIFKTLSLNDHTHLFALHTDLTIGPSVDQAHQLAVVLVVLPVGVSALGGLRPSPIFVSQPAPKRRRQVVPPVEVPLDHHLHPWSFLRLMVFRRRQFQILYQLTCHDQWLDTSGDWLKSGNWRMMSLFPIHSCH